MTTRWAVESRRYFVGDWEDGVAERVRAERLDACAWTRVLATVYWCPAREGKEWPAREGKEWPAREGKEWPAREGREWPCAVVPIPEWTGVGDETDAWAYFEAKLEIDKRYRWGPLPAGSLKGHS
jgi:hypothetical protein